MHSTSGRTLYRSSHGAWTRDYLRREPKCVGDPRVVSSWVNLRASTLLAATARLAHSLSPSYTDGFDNRCQRERPCRHRPKVPSYSWSAAHIQTPQ